MDVLARIFGGSLQASTPGPADDFWYQPAGGTVTAAGLRIDAESAQKVSAYFRGVDILSTALAMLPLPVYKRLPDGGREPVSIVLWDVVGRKPNPWQDTFQWRRQQMRHLIHWGNGYNRIVPGARGFLDQLHPIHPSLVTPEHLPTGRVLYHVRDPKTGTTTRYTQDDIFHLRGLSDDGIVGKGVLDYARDSVGLALTVESYASTMFSRGALHGGTIHNPGLLDEEAGKRMAKSFITAVGNWHMPKILEQGSTFTPTTMTAEQAQMLLSRKFAINDIARWLGLPSHMLGDLERATFSNIEHQGQEFVTYSLGPWLTLWESAINDQLIIQTGTYYVEFVRDALVRGDIKTRWDAYMKAVQTGCFTRNEIRELENRNKLPGLDEPLDPAHLTGKAGARAEDDEDTPPARQPRERATNRAEHIAQAAAARLLRKEIAAVQKLAVRHAADGDAFAVAVTEFYVTHAALVASTLAIESTRAEEYCASQAAQVLGDWMNAIETWQSEHYAAGLAGLALEEAAA
jgi:HK97 family phage portal protein